MLSWQKQMNDSPLFPDVVWSKPENKNGAGKLLILGGSSGNFAHTAQLFASCQFAGAGTIHVLVPDSLKPVTKLVPFLEYSSSNPSGGFARSALAEILEIEKIVDGVIIAGDLGKNSETSLLLEDFLTKTTKPIFMTSEALDSFANPLSLLEREKNVVVLSRSQLREIFIKSKNEVALQSQMPKQNFAQALHKFCKERDSTLVVSDNESVWVASKDKIFESQTREVDTAKIAVWATQQPEKWLQAIVTSLI